MTTHRNNYVAGAVCVAVFLCMGVFVYYGNDAVCLVTVESAQKGYAPLISGNSSSNNLRLSQIHLSRQLNFLKMEFGKLTCEINQLRSKELVTSSGGWCKADSSPNSKEHVTDYVFAKNMAEFLRGKRVGSFGDGPGLYKRFIDSTGLLSVYDAYDGAPYCEEVTFGAVKFLDLTVPQFGLPVYDWVVSLEVAEHIPASHEDVYVDNLVRHAKDGIILSWAVPGQGGHSHVNMKAFADVLTVMEKVGFRWDETSSKVLKKKASLSWLQRNVNVFKRMIKSDLTTSS